MSEFVEFNEKIAFHPGYYIKEIIEEVEKPEEGNKPDHSYHYLYH